MNANQIRKVNPLEIARATRRSARDWYRILFPRNDFAGFEGHNQIALMKAARTYFYRYGEQYRIPGWLTPRERSTLYALARCLEGPILEIGSWAGLSTTAIARGVRDSGKPKSFDTIDINPSEANFVSSDDEVGFLVSGNTQFVGVISAASYESMLPVLRYPGGPVGLLRENLKRLNLSNYVSIHVGDFRNLAPRKYNLVFCDALHDLVEIKQNAPHLNRFLGSGSILAVHDVGGDGGKNSSLDLQRALKKEIRLGRSVIVDSLYIAEVVHS